MNWTFGKAMRRHEIVRVPWCFDPIAHHIQLNSHESDEDWPKDGNTSVQWFLKQRVNFRHEEESNTCSDCNAWHNVTFSTILLSWWSHKVLWDEHLSILVLIESKHRYSVENGVNDTRSADQVGNPCYGQPQVLVNQIVTDLYDNHNECTKHDEHN